MNGRAIYIRDVAQVEEGIREQQSQFRQNGEPAIALRVIKRDDANTVAVAKDVKDLVKDLSSRYTELNFAVADDDSVFTQLVLNNMSSSIFFSPCFYCCHCAALYCQNYRYLCHRLLHALFHPNYYGLYESLRLNLKSNYHVSYNLKYRIYCRQLNCGVRKHLSPQ